MTKKLTLGRQERLKSRKLIDELFETGKKFSVPPIRVCYDLRPATSQGRHGSEIQAPVQIGTAVSRKGFKKAVDRNRIKRLIRETYRLQKGRLHQAVRERNVKMNVFFIYTGKDLPDFSLLKEKLGVTLEKLVRLVNESGPQSS